MSFKTKALIRGAPLIALAIVFLLSVGYVVAALFGLPSSLGLPLWLRMVGALLIAVGLGVMGLTVRLRGFSEVVVSTYITLWKFATKTPLEARAGREEPLVIAGPYKYVRSPLYFGAVVMVLGWGLLTTFTFLFVATAVVFLWFRAVLIPYEEKELRALFGLQFEQYQKEIPTIIPFTKPGGRRKTTERSAPPA
jgi:protein-S-isoprenylcysteine O-methyltransferase Ste14